MCNATTVLQIGQKDVSCFLGLVFLFKVALLCYNEIH